jgi:hypothetical protein
MRRSSLSRIIASALIALTLTGCSRTIDVPREQFEATSRRPDTTHRISMTDGETYIATEFSLNDSTLVIEKLHPQDTRYGTTAPPISLPLATVQSIKRIDEGPNWYIAVPAIGAFVLVAWLISSGEALTD